MALSRILYEVDYKNKKLGIVKIDKRLGYIEDYYKNLSYNDELLWLIKYINIYKSAIFYV